MLLYVPMYNIYLSVLTKVLRESKVRWRVNQSSSYGNLRVYAISVPDSSSLSKYTVQGHTYNVYVYAYSTL